MNSVGNEKHYSIKLSGHELYVSTISTFKPAENIIGEVFEHCITFGTRNDADVYHESELNEYLKKVTDKYPDLKDSLEIIEVKD